MSHHQDIKTAQLALYGFVGTAIVMVLILIMVVLYYQTTAGLEYRRNISQPYAELEKALEDQRIRLVEYAKGDTIEVNGQPQTQFQIPIDAAMEIVLAEWESGVAPGPPRKPVELTADGEAAEGEAADGEAADGEAAGNAAKPEKPELKQPEEKSDEPAPAAPKRDKRAEGPTKSSAKDSGEERQNDANS